MYNVYKLLFPFFNIYKVVSFFKHEVYVHGHAYWRLKDIDISRSAITFTVWYDLLVEHGICHVGSLVHKNQRLCR